MNDSMNQFRGASDPYALKSIQLAVPLWDPEGILVWEMVKKKRARDKAKKYIPNNDLQTGGKGKQYGQELV